MDYIEILLSSDDNYAKFCTTTMISVLKNTNSKIRFRIFDGGIKDYHKNKLLKLENKYKCKIIFYPIDKIDLFKSSIRYKDFNLVLESNSWEEYRFKKLLSCIFS